MSQPASHGHGLRTLLARFEQELGPQGWWPVRWERPATPGSLEPRALLGYHPGDFSSPKRARGRWEIATGAVLTQNTSWAQVERSLDALRAAACDSPTRVLAAPDEALFQAIRSSGYYRQKAGYLRALATWFLAEDRQLSRAEPTVVILQQARSQLLAVRGVGPETADSILLYAYKLPTFVVDAYTRRVLADAGFPQSLESYAKLRLWLQQELAQPEHAGTAAYWQECHAWFVEAAKRLRKARNKGAT